MEDIIIIALFLVFWVLPFLFKKMLKGKQKPTERKGFILRFLEFIAEIKKAAEQSRIAQEQVEVTPEPFLVKKEVKVPPAATVASYSTTNSHGRLKERNKQAAVQPEPTVIATRKEEAAKKFSKEKMRHAIVWSEILGAPIALRDN